MPEQFGDLIEGPARVDHVAGKGMSQLARAHPTVEPGPPGGGGNQHTHRIRWHRRADRLPEQVDHHKVPGTGARHPAALELVVVEGLHHQEVQRRHPLPADVAHAPFGLSRRTTCKCARGNSQPSRCESNSRCTSARRRPQASPRRSPALAISNTISRSRADRQPVNTATISSSLARSTAASGSCNRCRARIRQAKRASSPRASVGRSRSSASS